MSPSDSSRDTSSAVSAASDASIPDNPQQINCLKIRPSDNFTPIASLTPVEESDRFQIRDLPKQKGKFEFPEAKKAQKTVTPEIDQAFAADLDYAMRSNLNQDDLLFAPYPIKSMAPISFLEQLAQIALRVDILLKAQELGDDEIHEQTALATSFVIAFVGHLRNHAHLHPFMPVFGETFEVAAGESRNWRFLAEQVETNVTAISIMSPGFHFQQNLHLKSEYTPEKKQFCIVPSGSGRVVFEKTANDISWSLDGTRFTLTTSKKSPDCAAVVDGTFFLISANGDNANVTFQESIPEANVAFNALVFNRSHTRLIGLNGDLSESINGIFPAPKIRKDRTRARSPIREPVSVHLLTMKVLNPEARLKYSSRELASLPPTDSRHRADVLYMRRAMKADVPEEASGLLNKAQHKYEKYLRREYSRRVARAPVSGASEGYNNNNNNNAELNSAQFTTFEDPLWFERYIEGGRIRYRYVESESEEYWTASTNGGFARCPDPFDLFTKRRY